jgi:CO/xanthine dehydrogenase Mo-binding subunit
MRLEGPDKVAGRARYAGDRNLPGQLYARVLRSPHPHARLRRLDTSRAAALPGVRAVLSSADAPAISWYDESLLFDTTLRFVGDEVAAVAAEAPEIAEDALRLIEAVYEPLPFTLGFENLLKEKIQTVSRGDAAAGLRLAEVVVDEAYATQTALHQALEAHGCTAAWEGERLTLFESTQGMFDVRDEVAEKLGLPPERVRVVTEHMGGGFGAKQVAWKHSVIAALLARRAGRPVQLMLGREEECLASGNRNATRQHVRLGARRDGTLTAIEARILVQSGAYMAGGEASDVVGTYRTLYRCPNVRIEQVPARSNTGPAVAFRAPGHAEATFALESAMDELARKLGMDPVELRLQNIAEVDQSDGDKPYTNAGSLRHCMELVRQRMSPRRKNRGWGFAIHDWMGGSGWPPAEVRIERAAGRATVVTGAQDIGTGTRTAIARVAAEALGLPLGKIDVRLGDTDLGLRVVTSSGSASLASLGPAILEAAEKGEGKRKDNRKDKSIRTCGAQAVEVEVDAETGEVRVLRVVAAHDCGRIVDAVLVESQLCGGILQGLGYALMEERIVDAASGEVLNANLEEYKVPTVADLPEIVNAMESMPDPEANPTGAKGIGEPPIIPTAPAIANAVFDALGVRLRELPLKREKLLR